MIKKIKMIKIFLTLTVPLAQICSAANEWWRICDNNTSFKIKYSHSFCIFDRWAKSI